MYMNLEVVLVIGAFALLATAAGWARAIYFGIRQAESARNDARERTAQARQAFKAQQQVERASAEAR